jgi:hypothetical protein
VDEVERLKGLIANIPRKKISARLRNLMPEIDRQIRAGVRHEDIVETLNANGFSLNMNTFRTNLYQYRKNLSSLNIESESEPNKQIVQAHSKPSSEVCIDDGVPNTNQSSPSFDDILDARKRDAFSEQYLNRKKPIFNKRSKTDESSGD